MTDFRSIKNVNHPQVSDHTILFAALTISHEEKATTGIDLILTLNIATWTYTSRALVNA